MDSDCDSDSEHSVDSGLEESGHSNLEVEGGGMNKELVTLRKPTVYKSVPKVQAPTALARQPTGTVLDKIQAELAETRRREDELKRSRKQQLSRSQPDLTKFLPTGPEKAFEHCPEPDSPSEEEEEEPSSLLQTRGKSALISVWESRIQSADSITGALSAIIVDLFNII